MGCNDSVEELVTCAESRDIVALYALHEGVYVPYILGAPEFVNRAFERQHITALYALAAGEWVPYILAAPEFVNREFSELYAEGLPSITALVARSDGPPGAGSGQGSEAGNQVVRQAPSSADR